MFETTLLNALHPELVQLDCLPTVANVPLTSDDWSETRHDPKHPVYGVFGLYPGSFEPQRSGALLAAAVDWLVKEAFYPRQITVFINSRLLRDLPFIRRVTQCHFPETLVHCHCNLKGHPDDQVRAVAIDLRKLNTLNDDSESQSADENANLNLWPRSRLVLWRKK